MRTQWWQSFYGKQLQPTKSFDSRYANEEHTRWLLSRLWHTIAYSKIRFTHLNIKKYVPVYTRVGSYAQDSWRISEVSVRSSELGWLRTRRLWSSEMTRDAENYFERCEATLRNSGRCDPLRRSKMRGLQWIYVKWDARERHGPNKERSSEYIEGKC